MELIGKSSHRKEVWEHENVLYHFHYTNMAEEYWEHDGKKLRDKELLKVLSKERAERKSRMDFEASLSALRIKIDPTLESFTCWTYKENNIQHYVLRDCIISGTQFDEHFEIITSLEAKKGKLVLGVIENVKSSLKGGE